jgi:cell division protein FtsB
MFSRRYKVVAPKIVQQNSSGKKWWFLLFVGFSVALSWFAFDYGRLTSGVSRAAYEEKIDERDQTIKQLNQRVEQMRLEIASLQRSSQIDTSAAQLAREDLKRFQQDQAVLEREVAFLNSLLSDKAKKAVIRLKHLEITPTDESRQYRIEFSLLHLSKVGGKVKGSVSISVAGNDSGKPKVLPLEKLMSSGDFKSLKMGFKNFQKFIVTVNFPENFRPESLKIIADPEGKNVEKFVEDLNWKVTKN